MKKNANSIKRVSDNGSPYPTFQLNELIVYIDAEPEILITWFESYVEKTIGSTRDSDSHLLRIDGSTIERIGKRAIFNIVGMLYLYKQLNHPLRVPNVLSFELLPVGGMRTKVSLNSAVASSNVDYLLLLLKACFKDWPGTQFTLPYQVFMGIEYANEDDRLARDGAPRLEERIDWDDKVEKVDRIQDRLENGLSILHACELMGVSKSTYYRWKKRIELIESQ